MSSWNSYPKIFAFGHSAIKELLNHECNVEEKVDGSQFSFGVFDADPEDTTYSGRCIKVRSKGAVMVIDAPESLFKEACETVKRLADSLHLNWTYRGEVLKKPHHNALTYDRVPNGNIILFDVSTGDQEFLSYEDKKAEADRLGLEVVPLLYSGKIESVDRFRSFLNTISVLGGQAIEGVVVKPKEYNLYGLDKKVLMGKFVSEAFKEVHKRSWGESNPTSKDVIGLIGATYRTPARWNKAIQHLREAGKIEDSPKDIGLIMKEVPEDVLKECEQDMKDDLFKWAWPHIRRTLTTGFPQWYKELLLKQAFENEPAEQSVNGDIIGQTDRDTHSTNSTDSQENLG